MPRSFSLYRRRPDVVDMLIPDAGLVSGYSVAAATTFNGSFSEFAQVPYKLGKKSPSAKITAIPDSQYRLTTRFLFDPADYSGSVPAVNDLKPIWIKIAPISMGGSVGSYSSPQLLLPYSSVPNRVINLNGSIDTSTVEIVLPCDCNFATLQVEGTDSMTVAFEANGDTYKVDGVTSNGSPLTTGFPTFNTLFLTGSDSSVNFNISLRAMNSWVA